MPSESKQHLKPIIHSRNSSTDSRTSSHSTSSADSRYYETSTPTNRMSDRAYREGRVETRRVPNNSTHIMTTTTSTKGNVQVHAHGSPAWDPNEPRASAAGYEDYKRTKDYPRGFR